MPITMPAETLAILLEAAKRPLVGTTEWSVGSKVRRILEEGWAHHSDVADLIMDGDHRLRRGLIDVSVDQIVEALGYRYVDICYRPCKRSMSVGIITALSDATLAALLCDLEAIGFTTAAERLCAGILPKLDGKRILTSHELSVLWSGRTIGRSIMDMKAETEMPTVDYDEGRLPTGHRYVAFLDQTGKPVSIEIKGPKYRNTPSPVLRECKVCGKIYMHGDPESSASHRKTHRKVTRITNPKALPAMVEHLAASSDPELVTVDSPAWMHREVYDRAFAFKREMKYDFVQWTKDGREEDPDARGHLITDASGVIHGACAFRLRMDGDEPRWGLQWIWIRPEARRTGLLSERWDDYRRRYGDFHVEGPVSDDMQAFLQNRGEMHLMN